MRWIDGPYVRVGLMEDGLPLPEHPADTAPQDSSLLERVLFVVSAFCVYFYFNLLDFLPFPAALVVAIMAVPVLAELMVRITAKVGLFPESLRSLLIPVSMIPVRRCQGKTKRIPATTSKNSPAEITLP